MNKNRRKSTLLKLIFTCTAVDRKEVKLKEAITLGGLYTILMKEGASVRQRMIKHEVTRKHTELKEDKGYFSNVRLFKLILMLTLSLVIRTALPGGGGGGGTFTKGNLCHTRQMRRKWKPTPVFLPGESQGWGSLMGCHLWGRTKSHMTEAT